MIPPDPTTVHTSENEGNITLTLSLFPNHKKNGCILEIKISAPCYIRADLSQVQCIKSYQAQEHDELTLEKADILQAKTITSDGMTQDNGYFTLVYFRFLVNQFKIIQLTVGFMEFDNFDNFQWIFIVSCFSGWVEGIRLSDGERGWFPKTYVEEITSRSARLRNLRENIRIKCVTQKLEGEPP